MAPGDGKVVLEPVEEVPPAAGSETRPYVLEDLLAKVTEDNLHGEVDTGAPVGQEAW